MLRSLTVEELLMHRYVNPESKDFLMLRYVDLESKGLFDVNPESKGLFDA